VTTPFSKFANGTTAIDWQDVDFITFIFQSTTETLGNDYALKRIWFN
jgi:hypothetical protein